MRLRATRSTAVSHARGAVSAAAQWTPASLFASLTNGIWLSSSQGLFSDTAGSTSQATDNGTIQRWSDRSGFGNHLTQTTTANAPVLDTTRGDVCMTVAGSAKKLANTSYSYNRRDLAVLVVGRVNDSDSSKYIWEFGSLGLLLMLENGVIKVWVGSALSTTFKIETERVQSILVNASASGIDVYVNTVASKQTLTAAGVSTSTSFALGSTSGVVFGGYKEVIVSNRTLTTQEVSDLLGWASSTYGSQYVPASTAGRVVFDGDSVTRGVGATCTRGWVHKLNPSLSWSAHNFAITGQTLATMLTDQSETSALANATNWLFVLGGHNDLDAGTTGATVESRLASYCNAAITAGFSKSKIVVFTLTRNNNLTERDNFNTLVRANYTNYAGWLVDVMADSQLGMSGGTFNVPANYADGVHPTEAGAALFAALVRSTVTGLPF